MRVKITGQLDPSGRKVYNFDEITYEYYLDDTVETGFKAKGV